MMAVRRATADACPGFMLGPLACVTHPAGALWCPDQRTLLVADLHLEKGSSLAGRGVFLPPYDSRATLAALADTIAAFQPARVIALGDSFHDAGGSARLSDADRAALIGLQTGRDWLWLTGNHDPAPPLGCGGETAKSLELAGVMLRHEPQSSPGAPEIAGHLHPAAKVRLRGKAVRRRCFVTDGQRLILPAFGAYAGGLNVRDRAIAGLFAGDITALMLGDARVFAIAEPLLLPD
jgi:DNA ligase-associated metallophosphoesterase